MARTGKKWLAATAQEGEETRRAKKPQACRLGQGGLDRGIPDFFVEQLVFEVNQVVRKDGVPGAVFAIDVI
jgi:hypothetical protein